MIVRMRKLAALVHAADREAFLDGLRDLSVVHITQKRGEPAAGVRAALDARRELAAVIRSLQKSAPASTGSGLTAADIPTRFRVSEQRLDSIEQSLAQARKEQDALLPWGRFDPALLRALSERGVRARFFAVTPKIFRTLKLAEFPHVVVNTTDSRVYFVLFETQAPVSLPLEEARLPEASLSEVEARIKTLDEERKKLFHERTLLAADLPALKALFSKRDAEVDWVSAGESLDPVVNGRVLWLSGFFPAEKAEAVKSYLRQSGAWFEFTEPITGETVPVHLRHGPFARLFQPILKIFALPDYMEIDPTPFFAPFFMLFVGLCLGDVGYGSLLMITGIIAAVKSKGAMRSVFALVGLLGFSAILCGLLLNSFFGHTIFAGHGIPAGSAYFQSGAGLFAPLSSYEQNGVSVFPAMNFALFIGFIQVMLGILLRAVSRIRTQGFVAGLQPVSYLFMLLGGLVWGTHADFMRLGLGTFNVGPFNIGVLLLAVPKPLAQATTLGGLLLLLLFNNPGKPIAMRVTVLGLWELYGFVSGLLGDILSYLRLFILGLSGGLLGSVFTYIAFLPVTVDGKIEWGTPMIVLSLLLLVFGHTLNLCLCAIGSFVHPLRLTFVEFYKNLDFKGGGVPYKPFGLKQGNVNP